MMVNDTASLERVKTVALAHGVRIPADILAALGGTRSLTVHEYATTGGITLELPREVLVNAPFDDSFCDSSPLHLGRDREGLALFLGEVVVPVIRVLPLPGFLTATDGAGRRAADTVMSHADRIRVSPIVGCAYDCRFCDLGEMRYQKHSLEQLTASIDIALEDTVLPTNHLLISGGSPSRAAAQRAYFESVCFGIAKHVHARRGPDFEVDLMMSPLEDGATFVERAVEAGISSFSFNIEVFSDPSAAQHLPLKRKLAREHFEPMIQRAVELLGRESGRVRSLIIVGLEPAEGTLAGVEWLAAMGCHPVLSPFRPARGTKLAAAEPVTTELLDQVLHASRDITARHGVAIGPRCVACQHNTLSFPWDVPQAALAAPARG